MSAHTLRSITALTLACVLMALLLCLPAHAMPTTAIRRADAENIVDINTPIPEGEETLRESSPVTDGGMESRLPRDAEDNPNGRHQNDAAEQDPHSIIDQMVERDHGWITVVLCILLVISLLIIIATMIPKKPK